MNFRCEGAMKLYKVEIALDMYVLAADEEEAERVAMSDARHELENGAVEYVEEVTQECQVPRTWLHSLPYAPYGYKHDEQDIQTFLTQQSAGQKQEHPYLPGMKPKGT
jgi:hypothetical protein